VLLLAIGLGVLIGRLGHNSSNQKASTPPVQVVTLQGGGGGTGTSTGATTTPTHTTSASTAPKGLSGKLKKAATETAAPTKAVQQKATQEAGKVLGNSKNLAAPTTQQGGSCSGGAGCQSGKFTGNFFGQ